MYILFYLHVPQSLEALHAVKVWLDDVSLSILFRTTQLQDQLQSEDERQKFKQETWSSRSDH